MLFTQTREKRYRRICPVNYFLLGFQCPTRTVNIQRTRCWTQARNYGAHVVVPWLICLIDGLRIAEYLAEVHMQQRLSRLEVGRTADLLMTQ